MFCALLIPDFRLQAALRHRPGEWKTPVAVVDPETSLLLEMTPAAAAVGVRAGMNPAQGQARCLALRILSRAPGAEAAISEILAGIACAASAYVEQTAENLCTLDLQGIGMSEPGGLRAWGGRLAGRFEPFELRARAGIAENPDLALLAAQSATPSDPVRVVDDSRVFLGDLPLEVLEPGEAILSVLEGWGIGTLGGLTRLKKDQVAARLGPEGARLWDRARGRSTRLLRLMRPPERFEESFDFEHDIETAQPLLFLLRRFVDQLTRRLEALGLVAARMRLLLPLGDGSGYERFFQIPSPTADPEVLFRVLDTHFENLRLDFPPTGVRLGMEPAKPEHRQFRFFENAVRDPNRFAETLARIMAVVGGGNVGFPERTATHKPDQFALKMPDSSQGGESGGAPGPGAEQKGETGLPLRRFRPPLPAQVHLEKGYPRYVVSEQAHGVVADCLGPYRLSGEWWENGWSTEEWDVQMDDGALYRISRQGDTWQVEGNYEEGGKRKTIFHTPI